LRNGDFEHGLARWYPVARDDFLPWHIDSLPLEVLIERGTLGLTTLALLTGCALHALLAARNRGLTAAPFLAASLLGALLVGLVSSVLDAPRVAFLLLYLIAVSLASSENYEPVPKT
jgi:O-antigen ligase